jgi:hypothetical protein
MGYYQAIVNAVSTVTACCRLPGDFSLGYITAQTSLQTYRYKTNAIYTLCGQRLGWLYSGKASID